MFIEIAEAHPRFLRKQLVDIANCGLAGAISMIALRLAGPHEKRVTLYGAGMIGSMLITGVLMLADFRWPNLHQWLLLLGYGLLALSLVVATLFLWGWTLRRQVATRTAELTTTMGSLRKTEERFRTLFEQANDAIFIMQGAQVLDCTRQAERP